MSKRLFVGNLPRETDDAELNRTFTDFGPIVRAEVVVGRKFGFVELENDEAADRAVAEMNGHDLHGQPLTVAEARSSKKRVVIDDSHSSHRGGGGYRDKRDY